MFVSTFSDGRLLRIAITDPESVVEIDLPRPLDGGDALRLAPDGRLVAFENGLSHGVGRLTLVQVNGDRAQLSPLLETTASPTSGVVLDGDVLWPASNFGALFGGTASPYDPRLYRTPLR